MKPFKNKLAVTIVVLSVAFLGIITFSIKSNSTIISSGVGGVISPLQKIVLMLGWLSINSRMLLSISSLISVSRLPFLSQLSMTSQSATLLVFSNSNLLL